MMIRCPIINRINIKQKIYICDRCLHYVYPEFKLQKRTEDCQKMNECKIRLPAAGETIYFKKHKNKETVPFIVYVDLECLLVPVQNRKTEIQKHIPYSIGNYVKYFHNDSLFYYKSYQ